MFGRFMPTEGKFFEIFNAHAKCISTQVTNSNC